jgi:hypothetical protein
MTNQSSKQTTFWAQMYDAFCSNLQLSPENFQFLTPFVDWDWDVGLPGYTDSIQYEFLDMMPAWSPVGKYIPGSSFHEAYRMWLFALEKSKFVFDKARESYKKKKYYTQVNEINTKQSYQVPGYGEIDSYASWLQKKHQSGPTKITWTTGDTTSNFTSSWAKGSDLIETPCIESSGGNLEKKHYQITIKFKAWSMIQVTPLDWYQETVIKAYGKNPGSYKEDFKPYENSPGSGQWIFGKGGVMPLRITALLVALNPVFAVRELGATTKSGQDDAGVKLSFFGTKSSKKKGASFPVIFGIYLSKLG